MSNASRYIDLDRRFRQLDPRADPEREAAQSYTATLFLATSGLAWNDILARTRVVVLGEPGSGKTWEFRQQFPVRGTSGVSLALLGEVVAVRKGSVAGTIACEGGRQGTRPAFNRVNPVGIGRKCSDGADREPNS